jgi:hypothetical protein
MNCGIWSRFGFAFPLSGKKGELQLLSGMCQAKRPVFEDRAFASREE